MEFNSYDWVTAIFPGDIKISTFNCRINVNTAALYVDVNVHNS